MQAFTGKSYKFFRFFYSVIAIDGIYWKCSGICLLQMGPNFTFLSYSAGNIHAVVNNTDGVRYVATYLAKEIKDAVVFMITRFSQETRMKSRSLWSSVTLLAFLLAPVCSFAVEWLHPVPEPSIPGSAFYPRIPKVAPVGSGNPEIYSYTRDAGPDESFFLAGGDLSSDVTMWGVDPDNPEGVAFQPRIQQTDENDVIATIPDTRPNGLFFVWVNGKEGASNVIRLNAPEPWWCGPDIAHPGETVCVFGRRLTQLPDNVTAYVYLCKPGMKGQWMQVLNPSQYAVRFQIPRAFKPGNYQVWVYAGMGGDAGWGGPVSLRITPEPAVRKVIRFESVQGGLRLQKLLDSARPNEVVKISSGTVTLFRTLRIPAGVVLAGSGMSRTILRLSSSGKGRLVRRISGWNMAVSELQDIGDRLIYRIRAPQSGHWSLWMRYAADDSGYGYGMSGRTEMIVNGVESVPLSPAPNTSGWGNFEWTKCAVLTLKKGGNTLEWRNVKGGGVNLDAFVLAKSPNWKPGDLNSIKSGSDLIVFQAEAVAKAITKQAEFPREGSPVVWMSGDNSGLENLSVLGNARVTTGVEVKSPVPLGWIHGGVIRGVEVADADGKWDENIGLHLRRVDHFLVTKCRFTGRAPIFFSGARQCEVSDNLCYPATRFGGNAEAALLSRTEPLEQCRIEKNVIVGRRFAGGPTARRLIWFSTGHGSVDENWIYGNRGEHCRFGGVAGTDQNVGETILFESNMRLAYYGSPVAVYPEGIALPPSAYTPPLKDDGTIEPPLGEYYICVVHGVGLGQARRVIGRIGTKLLLDRPWRVPPTPSSVVVMEPMFARNLVVGNETVDGMCGIQLWIGGVENVYADNIIKRERREGVYLFAAASTLDASMPNQWNAGIGPLLYNTVEGNMADRTAQAFSLMADGKLPAANGSKLVLAIGNVFRYNTGTNSRISGLSISAGSSSPNAKPYKAVIGTIAEFNVMRDQPIAYSAGDWVWDTLFRRDHAYFWDMAAGEKPVGFDTNGSSFTVLKENNIEDLVGGEIPNSQP